MRIKDEFLAVLDALKAAAIDPAVCGGWAVGIHGYPRATRDINLLVLEEDVEVIKEKLRSIGYTLSSGRIPFKVGTPQEQRLFCPRRRTRELDCHEGNCRSSERPTRH